MQHSLVLAMCGADCWVTRNFEQQLVHQLLSQEQKAGAGLFLRRSPAV